MIVRTDPTIDFSWGASAAGYGLRGDRFSVRWTGQVEAPVTGAYRFATVSDAGVRLWVNGSKVIDHWTQHSQATDTSAAVNLVAGQRYNVLMEYFDMTGNATAKLLWSYPGQDQQVIPQARLMPPSTTFLSDMAWISATNGSGPVERDKSVGGNGAGDGRALSINGVKFAKGLGVRAPSEIRYALGGRFTDFTASIGIDDEVPGSNGQVRFQVWRDGVKAYESVSLNAGHRARYIEVDVSGANELKLVVVDAGGGVTLDNADWADAQVINNPRPFLSDLRWKSSRNGWGPTELDQSNGERDDDDGRLISIAGRKFEKGLGVHAASDVRYDLSGAYTRFNAQVGVDDEVPTGQGSVIFQVFLDGVKAFETPSMKSGEAPRAIDLSVSGKDELRLVVVGGSDITYDHADWAEARLTRSATPPPAIPGAPSDLEARAGDKLVKLDWDPAPRAVSYRILRGTAAGQQSSTPIATVTDDTDYVDRAVTNGTKYFYKVLAVNAAGAGPASNEASATPNPAAPPLPSAPTNLSADAAVGRIRLTWRAATAAATYNVYRGTTSWQQAVQPIATGVTGTTFNDTTVKPSTAYFYKVAGVNATGIGPKSNEAKEESYPAVPTAPTRLTAVGGDRKVLLTWVTAPGAETYNIYRGTSAGGENANPIARGVRGLTFTDTSVANGTRYFYKVAGLNVSGTGPMSNEADATPSAGGGAVPATPTNLSAAGSDRRVQLAWSAAAGATSYNVYRGTAAGGQGATPIATGVTALTFADTTVTNGTRYFYKVAGVNAAGTGPMSNEANATPQSALPAAPAGLSAVGSDKKVQLAWSAAAGATSYNVYRGTAAGGQGAAPIATGVTALTFADTTVTNGTRYFYKVAGVNAAGTGPMSNEANATPQSALPAAPTGLSAVGSDKKVQLAWSAAAGATSYNVYRGTAAGGQAATPIATGVTALTFADTTVTNGTAYFYKVAGVNTAGVGPMSNEANATPQSALPAAPTGLSASGSDKKVQLTWAAATGATSYNVYRGTAAGGQAAAPIATGVTALTFADTTVTNGTAYFYKVAGVNTAGTGPMSNEANATPQVALPPAPTGLSATGADKQVTLSWTSATGAASYNVYRGTAAGGQAATPVATGITATTFTDTNLTNGTRYFYKVAGVNGAGTGPMSNEANATPQVAIPPAPAGLSAIAADRQVSLAWTAATGAASYNVYRGTTAGGQAASPVATGITGTTFIDTNLTNGTAYFYKVAGVNAAGTGAMSNEASATPQVALPAAPAGLTATSGDREVRLSWTVVPGATSYNVFRGTTPNGQGAAPIASNLTVANYIDTGLTNGTAYYYKVAAVNAAGTGALSTESNATPNPVTQPPSAAIHRFLRQSSWGPTQATMDRVQQIGIDAYLDEQFNTPASQFPDTLLSMPLEWSQEQMAQNAISGPDQLRQRVAWALHKIWVVSGVEVPDPRAFLPYYRGLQDNAFGNYLDIMRTVTLTPAMGEYLDMVNNGKATATSQPNENYARELLQLFTLGLVRLNPDGSQQTDTSGNPIQLYEQEDVIDLARALTGWTYGDNVAGNPNAFRGPSYVGPMEPVASQHDTGSKTVLGQFIPANQTATQDLESALQIIFNHPNIGPFVSKALIQQLVTSNPSPAYVQRIAGVFANNGSGVRGDMRAVVRAILKDSEAALGQPGSGHLREPVLFVTNVLRSLGATVADHPILTDATEDMSQRIFYPGSVFSYFSPFYRTTGGVPGPEFQIYTTFTALRRPNFVARLLNNGFGTDIVIDYTAWNNLATDANALVDRANTMLMGGQMSAQMRQSIITAVNASPTPVEKVRSTLYLTLTSSQYQVEH